MVWEKYNANIQLYMGISKTVINIMVPFNITHKHDLWDVKYKHKNPETVYCFCQISFIILIRIVII